MHGIENGTHHPGHRALREAAGFSAFRGSGATPQARADQLVRATVFAGLGQQGGASSVRSIAAAIQKVLGASDTPGTDVPDDVLKNIEQSLRKAAQALADRGVDGKTIDETIDRFRSQLADALDQLLGIQGSGAAGTPQDPDAAAITPPATQPSTAASESSVDRFVAREVRKQKGTLELVTAEGDQVSIRFRERTVASASVTQSTGADGSVTTEARTSLVSRGRLQIEVQGDLNEEELAAIGDLLGKVDEIATKFFSGDVQEAFTAATQLGVDSDQIASYQLDLTYSRRFAAAAAYRSAGGALPAPSPSPTTQPPATPQVDASAGTAGGSNAQATNGSTGTASDDALPAPAAVATETSDEAAAPVADPEPETTPPASAQKTIASFIGEILSRLGSVDGAGSLQFSARWKVSLLVTALQAVQPDVASTPAEETTAANTELLGDALGSAVS